MSKTIRNACAGILGTAIAMALSAHAAQPAADTPLRKAGLRSAPAQNSFNRFVVKYQDGAVGTRSLRAGAQLDSRLDAAARIAASSAGTRSVAPATFRQLRSTATGATVITASRMLSAAESDAFLAELRRDPAVRYAQPDYMRYAMAVPTDPEFSALQWDMTDETGGVRAPAAWETGAGEGTVVAVIDTGYTDHPDLVDNIVPGYDFISYYGQSTAEGLYPDVAGDGDGRDADAHDPGDWVDQSMSGWCRQMGSSSWHGTHVAGTVAAVANNDRDIAGLAHGAKVQPVRVLGHCGGITSDIADGIIWASGGHVEGVPDNQTPAEVINLSLGGPGRCEDDPLTQEAIDGAIARGVTVVVAAGNEGDNAANYSPASCRGVITVGATGIDGARAYFSNYGAEVAIAAPGGNAQYSNDPDDRWIWSLGNAGATVPAEHGLIGMIGTSQAAPHVAAAAAMMQSAAVAAGKDPLTPSQVGQILRNTARPFVVNPGVNTPIGAGILDVGAAVAAAVAPPPEQGDATPLTNNVAETNLSGAAGDSQLYALDVPEGALSLNLRTFGGSGDVSLYVSHDAVPEVDAHERMSARPGNSESVVVTRPAAGTWYVRVVGNAAYSKVSLLGLYR